MLLVGLAIVHRKTSPSDDVIACGHCSFTVALPHCARVGLVPPPVGGAIHLVQDQLWKRVVGWLTLSLAATTSFDFERKNERRQNERSQMKERRKMKEAKSPRGDYINELPN